MRQDLMQDCTVSALRSGEPYLCSSSGVISRYIFDVAKFFQILNVLMVSGNASDASQTHDLFSADPYGTLLLVFMPE